MASTSNVQITIALQEPDLDDDELQDETQRLLQQMLQLDEVEDASLFREAEAPAGSKSLTGLAVGWLTAQVNAKNIKALMGFLGDRLGNKTIELEIEANGKKLKVKASSRQELEAAIEAQVKARIEAYKRHLQHYRQSLAKAMRQEYPLSQPTRHQLQQMQQEWQLKDEDLAVIENSLTAEVEAYRQKLQQFEQAFIRAVQQEYPLSEANHNQLWQQQQLLGLKAEDIHPITARVTAEREAYQQKLQQYEQVITQAIEHQYPFTEEIREELRRYQHVLEIRDEEVARIEQKVVRQRETNKPQIQQSNTYEPPVAQSHSIDVDKFLEEVKADELPTQFLSRLVTQVIPETKPVKTPKLPLHWILPLIFVVAAGFLGLFVKQLRSPSGASPIFSNPLQTQNPAIEATPAPRSLANLSPGWVIKTNKEISLGNNLSLPSGTYLEVIEKKSNPNPPFGSFLVSMRVCANNKSTQTPANPNNPAVTTSVPPNSKPLPATVLLNSSQVNRFGVVLQSDAPNPCITVTQPPVTEPSDTSPT